MSTSNQTSVTATREISRVAAEPECCGEPMIRYPGTGWECASAYFALFDAGVTDPNGSWPLQLIDRATPVGQRELLAHVDKTRITEPLS